MIHVPIQRTNRWPECDSPWILHHLSTCQMFAWSATGKKLNVMNVIQQKYTKLWLWLGREALVRHRSLWQGCSLLHGMWKAKCEMCNVNCGRKPENQTDYNVMKYVKIGSCKLVNKLINKCQGVERDLLQWIMFPMYALPSCLPI